MEIIVVNTIATTLQKSLFWFYIGWYAELLFQKASGLLEFCGIHKTCNVKQHQKH